MRLLPNEKIHIHYGCGEKINSYLILADHGLPVLRSVYVPKEELNLWGAEDARKAKRYLNSSYTMLRYIYRCACHKIKDGGVIVPVCRSYIMAQMPDQADAWLLEPVEKTDNQSCFNMSINRDLENLHIEILGEGFDVSDLNKGVISPHEIMDMPFPFVNGYYNEWWKWAKIHICSIEEYQNSVRIRKARLKKNGKEIRLPEQFTPIRLELLDKIRSYLQLIEPWILKTNLRFVNVSCSVLKSGRFVFWDIQTPEGKYIAYMK